MELDFSESLSSGSQGALEQWWGCLSGFPRKWTTSGPAEIHEVSPLEEGAPLAAQEDCQSAQKSRVVPEAQCEV